MSSRQSAELDHAFERNGWVAGDIKWLSSGDNLEKVLKVRRGISRIVKTEISSLFLPITVAVSATTVPFVARKYFVVNTAENAPVKISYLSEDFIKWFLEKKETPFEGSTLRYVDLSHNSLDSLIIRELGGERKAEITLTEIFALIQAQSNMKEGPLFTGFHSNNFYVKDVDDVLRRIYLLQGKDGWRVFAEGTSSLPGEVGVGDRIFSRDFH
jgi:hypothetical protein